MSKYHNAVLKKVYRITKKNPNRTLNSAYASVVEHANSKLISLAKELNVPLTARLTDEDSRKLARYMYQRRKAMKKQTNKPNNVHETDDFIKE